MIQLELEFDGHVFVPQQPVDLPAGYKVTVSVESGPAPAREPVAGKTSLQKLANPGNDVSPDTGLPAASRF